MKTFDFRISKKKRFSCSNVYTKTTFSLCKTAVPRFQLGDSGENSENVSISANIQNKLYFENR